MRPNSRHTEPAAAATEGAFAIALVAFTEAGCRLAQRVATNLSREGAFADAAFSISGPARYAPGCGVDAYGSLAQWTARHFAHDDALVFVGASGIAVRAIAPHVRDKFTDPAVVSVDERGAFAVPLLSGHVGGANDLARAVAAAAGGQAAISTATDVNGLFAIDEWAARHGMAIVERVTAKQVSARLLEGGTVGFVADDGLACDVPAEDCGLRVFARRDDARASGLDLGVAVSLDDTCSPFARTLHLVPRVATVGVGCRKGTDPVVLQRAVDAALAEARISHHAVDALASIDVKAGEPAILQLASERGWRVRFYSAAELAAVPGSFAASSFVVRTVGVDNVCERSAVKGGGRLVVGKRAGDGVTVAIAIHDERALCATDGKDGAPVPKPGMDEKDIDMDSQNATGRLVVVGLGPGGAADMSARARAAVQDSDLVAGYTVYVDLLRAEFPEKEMLTTPMRKEVERCRLALDAAAKGRKVVMVCSGDPGVYGMAGLVYELANEYPGVDIGVIPGVSACNGGAAVLGAPLMHDYCVISLSDLLTPWEKIENRLSAAAQADFVISLYNPSSRKRPDYLQRACDVLLRYKSPETVCGTVRNIGREGEQAAVMTLGELRDATVDMFTTVFIGNSQTLNLDGKMVTPRGYLQRQD